MLYSYDFVLFPQSVPLLFYFIHIGTSHSSVLVLDDSDDSSLSLTDSSTLSPFPDSASSGVENSLLSDSYEKRKYSKTNPRFVECEVDVDGEVLQDDQISIDLEDLPDFSEVELIEKESNSASSVDVQVSHSKSHSESSYPENFNWSSDDADPVHRNAISSLPVLDDDTLNINHSELYESSGTIVSK